MLPLEGTAQYMTVTERYQFSETGAGCIEHGEPACLCDVTMDGPPTPIVYSLDEVRFGGFACERADTFHEWAEIVLGCAEVAQARPELFEALEVLRESMTNPSPSSLERVRTEAEIAATLLRGGCDLESAAATMGTTIMRLVRLRIGDGAMASWSEDRIVALERRILGGGASYVELAKEFDVDRTTIKRFADWYGIELTTRTTKAEVREYALTLDVSAAEVVERVRERFGVEVKVATVWKWWSRAA